MLTRRGLMKSLAAAWLAAVLWRSQVALAQDDFDDDWPDRGDDRGDDGDNEPKPPESPEAPDPPEESGESESGGFGDQDRDLIDLSTGSQSFDGPLVAQATSDPMQSTDAFYRAGLFNGLSTQDHSVLDGNLETGRLISEATSSGSNDKDPEDKPFVSLDINFGGAGEKAVNQEGDGIVGVFGLSSPGLGSQTVGGFAGFDAVGAWASYTWNNDGKPDPGWAGGLYFGLPGEGEIFVGLGDHLSTLEVGLMVQGGLVELDVNLPVIGNWIEHQAADAYRELEVGIETLYGVP